MPARLPLVPSIGDYTFSCTLDGTSYNFRVRWNIRSAMWFLDVANVGGTPIANGIALALGPQIGSAWRYVQPFRYGSFIAIDTSGTGRDAGYDDLGTRVVVDYYTENEIIVEDLGAVTT